MIKVQTKVSGETKKETKKLTDNIADTLIDNNIAACVSTHKVESRYIWEGEKTIHHEIAIEIKTTQSFEKVAEEIEKIHPYDLPEITAVEPKTTKEYRDWVDKNS